MVIIDITNSKAFLETGHNHFIEKVLCMDHFVILRNLYGYEFVNIKIFNSEESYEACAVSLYVFP